MALITTRIHAGFEANTADAVTVPFKHTVLTGITQHGKTSLIESLMERVLAKDSDMKAVAFRTKRDETGFEKYPRIPLYYKEDAGWQYVSSLLEAMLRENMKFERSWIMEVCKDAKTLREVYNNIKAQLDRPKIGEFRKSIFTKLENYFEMVLPQLEALEFVHELKLMERVSVVDLIGLNDEVQLLIIRAILSEIYQNHRNTLIVIPEFWKVAPQQRGTPVKAVLEPIIKEGMVRKVVCWFDSQDLGGTDKLFLRQVDCWILGRQRQTDEVERTIKEMPITPKPKPTEVMTLKLGHFWVCCDDTVKLVYGQPTWLPDDIAREVAAGRMKPDSDEVQKFVPERVMAPLINQKKKALPAAAVNPSLKFKSGSEEAEAEKLVALAARMDEVEAKIRGL